MAMRRIFGGPGAVYHCMTRTVNGERLFDDTAKEILRRQIHQVAEFCGVQVIPPPSCRTIWPAPSEGMRSCRASPSEHLLVKVARPREISDAELIPCYRVLYPRPTKHAAAHAEVPEEVLETGGMQADLLRKRLLKLMGDLCQSS